MIKTVVAAALTLTMVTVAFADTTKPRHAASAQKASATVVTHTSATSKGGSNGATANAKRGASAEPMKQCVMAHPAAGCF
jgi:hypothetical protein